MNFKYLFVLSLAVAFTSTVFAQNFDDITDDDSDDFGNVYNKFSYQEDVTINPNDYDVNINFGQETNLRKIFSDEFRYKWYFQLGGGLQTIWGANDPKGKFMKRLTLSPNLAVGYRFNTKFGARVTLSGGTVHGFNDGKSGRYRYWKKKGQAVRQQFLDDIRGRNPDINPDGNPLPQGLNESQVSQIDPIWIDKGYTYGGTSGAINDHDKFYSTYNGNAASGVDDLLGFIWGGNTTNSDENLYMRSTRYLAADFSGTVNLTSLFRDGADDVSFFEASVFGGPTLFIHSLMKVI